jgi:fibrillarin-like pre-rRNA processing protein
MKNTRNRQHQKNLNQDLKGHLNVENNVLHEETIEADSEVAAKTLAEGIEAQDHHGRVEAEAAISVTAAGEIEAIDAVAVAAAVKTGDQTDVHLKVKPHPKFKEIYQVILEDGAQRLATKNLTPGLRVYGERLFKFKYVEYRVWDAFRSKLAGGIIKGVQNVPIEPSFKVLYLGAASGTTPSHVSDIVGDNGHVYCVEFAQRSLRDLVNNVAAYRTNISPMLEDARMPERYAMFISGKVDTIYCDVAQPEQAKLLADNADVFLKPNGWVMLACKSQSIDVTMDPNAVYRQEAHILRNRGFDVKEIVDLEPYDKAHAMIVAQKL